MCRIPPPPLPLVTCATFDAWWRSGKCVGFPPTPAPLPAHQLSWDLRDFRGWRRSYKQCVVPPPPFFYPGSAPACGCSLLLLYAHWACLRSPNVHAALPLRLWSSWSCPRYCSEACNRFTIVHWNDIPASFWLLHTTFTQAHIILA